MTKTRKEVVKPEILKAREELLKDEAKAEAVEQEKPRYRPEKWLADNQIYCDSYGCCWGVMPISLDTVYLGSFEHVNQVLQTKTIPENQCHDARIVLQSVLDDMEEQYGKPATSRPGLQRGRTPRAARAKQKATRKTKT